MITKEKAPQRSGGAFSYLLLKQTWNVQEDKAENNENSNNSPNTLDCFLVFWIENHIS